MPYINYVSTNPCLCPQGGGGGAPAPSPAPCQCISLCNIVINANDDLAVGPCGATGTVDLSSEAYGHDLCACGGDSVVWSVYSFDDSIFATASVVPATGVLSWITMGPESLAQQYGTIIVKVCCGQLSAYMNVTIGIKDLCNCSGAAPCDGCDPCTGLTISQTVNVGVNPLSNPANTSVNVTTN